MEDKKYCIYCHTNNVNKKKYIGITKRIPKYRWNNGKGYISNYYFYNAINKYGWDNFEHEILFENLTETEAKLLEIKLIKEMNTLFPNGYNITLGGDTNWKASRRIICVETSEIFKDEYEVYILNKDLFKNKYTQQNFIDCCNYKLPYLKIPYSSKKYHYQFTREYLNLDISYIEDKCRARAKTKFLENTKTISKERRYHFKNKKEFGKLILNWVDNVCVNCGEIYRSNRSSDKGICEKCKKHGIKILKSDIC